MNFTSWNTPLQLPLSAKERDHAEEDGYGERFTIISRLSDNGTFLVVAVALRDEKRIGAAYYFGVPPSEVQDATDKIRQWIKQCGAWRLSLLGGELGMS